jgi:hypothetical protein
VLCLQAKQVPLPETILQELRDMARRSVPASQLLLHLQRRLGIDLKDDHLLTVKYFREAFALSLRDAASIRGCPLIGGLRHDADVDQEMGPKIQANRWLWEE